jgi:hypothetical protein
LVDGTQTWNNAATTFTGLKLNVNNTASNAASLLMDLQLGTVSKFSVRNDGRITASELVVTNIYGGNLVQLTSGAGRFDLAGDLFITRRAAANARLGIADAAAPVAQTLSVQSVVAGTSNTAGANFTITGSQGTGSGTGGSIIFQTAAANSGGGATVQNTLANAMVIDSVKTVRLGTGYTVATLPAAGTAGRRTYVTDATAPTFLGALIGGGAVVCPVFDNGTAWVSA